MPLAQPAGGPLPQVCTEFTFTLERIDIDAAITAEQTARHIAAEARRTFDLSRDLLLRACHVQATDGGLLLLTLHHIAADGWSLRLIANEFARARQQLLARRPASQA